MTIEDLHSNEELRRHEFPAVQQSVFLGHAGVCPLPHRVARRIEEFARAGTLGDQEEAFAGGRIQRIRELAARLLSAQMDEIALVGPTSLALSLVAAGLPFRKGDNILIYHDDYPANVYPWMALAARGVEVRLLNVRALGRIRAVDVQGQVDENTRLVALASCHFISGFRIDVSGLGAWLRGRGILFCVDGIQTLGAFPTSVEHVDFLAADAHKWLLGPCAAGIFYVRKAVQEQLRPAALGWHNVRCPNFVAQEQLVHPPDARRYEAGSANLLGLAGLEAALELIHEVGVDNISAELLRQRALLVPALQAKDFTVLEADAPPQHASGIVTFFKPGVDLPALHQKLADSRILTSLRADRTGQRHLRLSPHFYNTDAELQRVLERL
jgi:selenocysteine lyase/cysteine desulfurase